MTEVINFYHHPNYSKGFGVRYRAQDEYIGRGSKWGNPFTHLPPGTTTATTQVATREEAISRYEEWLQTQPELLAALPSLKGKTLVCFCKPQSCHGDVLARLADQT